MTLDQPTIDQPTICPWCYVRVTAGMTGGGMKPVMAPSPNGLGDLCWWHKGCLADYHRIHDAQ